MWPLRSASRGEAIRECYQESSNTLVLHGTASKGQMAGFVETCVSQDLLGLIKPTLHRAREAQDITLDKKFILVSESSEKTQF